MVDLADLPRHKRNTKREEPLDIGAYLESRGITLEEHKAKMLMVATEEAGRIQLPFTARLALQDAGINLRERVLEVDSRFKRAALGALPLRYELTAYDRLMREASSQYGRQIKSIQSVLEQAQPYYFYIQTNNFEKLKFEEKLERLLVNVTPVMPIKDIVILWHQDYRDKNKRIKRAKQLIELVIAGLLDTHFREPAIHRLCFKKQLATRIHIDDFEKAALAGNISKKAPEFSMSWRSHLKSFVSSKQNLKQQPLAIEGIEQLECVVTSNKNSEIPKKNQRESKAIKLVIACLDEWKKVQPGLPSHSEQLFSFCIRNPPQGYSDFQRDTTEKKYVFREAMQADSVQVRAFKEAFEKLRAHKDI